MKLLTCVIATIIIGFGSASYGQEWKQIGPDPIGGETDTNLPNATSSGMVDGIAIDPSGRTDSTIYIATAAGGVWKTVDGGSTWSSKDNSMPVLFMGAVTLDPSNSTTVYAGIGGEYCCFSGGGIYRSTDGADQWKLYNPNGIFTGTGVNALALPKSDTLLVATGMDCTNRSMAAKILAPIRQNLTMESQFRSRRRKEFRRTGTSQI